MNKLIFATLLTIFACGCASVNVSSPLPNGDKLLVLQNDGYELFCLLPIASGNLTVDENTQEVSTSVSFFKNKATTDSLYKAAEAIAKKENCDLVDVTFIDNFVPSICTENFGGIMGCSDVTMSAVLRPRTAEK